MRIIIADDSVLMRRSLKSILKQLGHVVIGEAANGKEAVALYKMFKPDLITMDITMPVMDGIEAVNEIVKEYPDANIIMISALNQKEMVFKAIERGAKYYIIKPFDVNMVVKALDQLQALKVIEKASVDERPQLKSPYTVINENGAFVIRINALLNNRQLTELRGTFQGLLAIPDVNIILDITRTTLSDEIERYVDPMIKLINEKRKIVTIRK
jgi:YesN/AraC family two-component response regulator